MSPSTWTSGPMAPQPGDTQLLVITGTSRAHGPTVHGPIDQATAQHLGEHLDAVGVPVSFDLVPLLPATVDGLREAGWIA